MDPRTFKAIRNAIGHEKESVTLYKRLADKFDGPARDFCLQMVVEEQRHESMLENLGPTDLQKFQERLDRMGAYHIDIPLPKDDSIPELFKIAKIREQASIGMYTRYASHADGELKRFFENMVVEEEKHLHMIKDAIARYNQ
ncbi:MAG: hypothetical protein ACQESG_08265 [Nanobdellota archaeon]